VEELALLQLNNSQNASIARVTERDVKHLQHEMKQMHSIKKEVEAMHEATNSSVSTMQADLRKMQLEQQAGAADNSTAEIHSKILDVQRNMTLENIRLDKTATTVHEIQCRLAA
jgi:hypothetical protein